MTTKFTNKCWKILLGLLLMGVFTTSNICAQERTKNKPGRLQWFGDLGYGLFIHWSVDSQIGTVISHSLVGASKAYADKFFNELPKTFDPYKFNPDEWARLAKVAGVKYVVFTNKHHSGFCMFDTKTTDFNIMNTPYGKDITKELYDAFRKQGIAIGVYFSPDDFHVLYEQGKLISRKRPEALPPNNPGLMKHNKQQIRELLTNYGKIDILFIDGPTEGITDLAWKINPDLVITRGVLKTPEIAPSTSDGLPKSLLSDVWEANYTMGTGWQYKPTNDQYRSGTDLIENLIEARAKRGNMLLNIGPKPDGEIDQDQKDILREIGTWLFINGEAIYDTKPWIISNEGNIWFTQSKKEDAVYAILTKRTIKFRAQDSVTLKSVKVTKNTEMHVLGQNGKVLEYRPDTTPKTTWKNTKDGLKINFYRAQRVYNDGKWPNPITIKITNPEPVKQ